jgi:hypothetical protein
MKSTRKFKRTLIDCGLFLTAVTVILVLSMTITIGWAVQLLTKPWVNKVWRKDFMIRYETIISDYRAILNSIRNPFKG